MPKGGENERKSKEKKEKRMSEMTDDRDREDLEKVNVQVDSQLRLGRTI